MKVLVTGGTGLVGTAIKSIQPEWIYLSSKDCDFNDFTSVQILLQKINPDVIIHLAANVGGLFKNASNRLEMFNSNLLLNYNLLENAYRLNINRVICSLSTCIFPDGLNRVLTENDLHLGEPHISNYGYAYAKRMMEVQCRLYNETPGFNYQCIIPTNIYGPHDNFNLKDSHVIPGLIHKAFLHSTEMNDGPFVILGTGLPKRQFIYSHDLANIIVRLVLENITEPLLICSTPVTDEITILDVAKLIGNVLHIQNVIPAETEIGNNDGQQIKTSSPDRLLTLMPDLTFTPIEVGLEKTVTWFLDNYPNIRK
jgi:GDP-L-fucose synthase